MLSLDSKNRILDEVAYMAATGNLFFVTEDEEAETQQRSEDFILGDYTVTNLLEYRSLQKMGVDVFFDILPGLTRTFSPRKRAKNCKKGIACGNTCIAKNRVCKQNLSPAVATQVPPAKAKTKKAAGGATTAPAAPAASSAPAPASPATPQTTVSKGADPNLQKTLDTYQKEAKKAQYSLVVPNSIGDTVLKASEASWAAIKKANKAGKDVVFLKDEKGEVIAAASLKEETKGGVTTTYIDSLAVRPRNLPMFNPDKPGAGKELLDQIVAEAHSQGKNAAVNGFKSPGLIDFFENAGFSDSGKVDKDSMPIYVNEASNKKATSKTDPAPAPAAPTPEFVPKGIYTQAEYNSLDTEHKKRLFRIATGLEDDRPLSEQKSGDRTLLYFNKTKAQQAKVFNILHDNPNLTKAEADAVAHWINHEYKTVNKSIYAPNSLSPKDKKIGEAGAIRTSQALRKMPPVTSKEIRKIAKERGEPSELAKDKKLRRHIKDVPDLDAFLAPYEQAQKSGKPHLEPTVFATTAKNNLDHFQSGAQVTFVIKAKLDGTGSGRTVDQYKNEAWEGEVLYPSFTGFKVNKITRQQGEPAIIEMEEL